VPTIQNGRHRVDDTNLLDAQSICLTIPVFNPSEQEEPLVIREQAKARSNRIALGKLALSMLKEPALPESSRKLPEEVS
jgi:hypothetical protein